MKFNAASIKRVFLGAVIIAGGYIGVVSTGGGGGNAGPGFIAPINVALYDPVGEWSTWDMAPAYAPALAGQVFDVTYYGADPTNTENSTYAIRSALAAAKAWQAANANALVTVYIPEGVYACWRETSGTEDFIFTLHQDNLVIEGDGPDKTILNARATAGADPNTMMQARGILFCTRGVHPAALDGITFRGMRMTGNAPANLYAGQFSSDIDPATGYPYDARGWDVNHKPIGIWDNVTNIIVEDCEFDNWRGEMVYGGSGLESGTSIIRRCLFRSCNASVISINGDVTIQDCEIYDAYNGVECFMLGAQSLTVSGSVIDILRSGTVSGSNGIVYLGYAASSATITGNTIGKCNAGILLNGMASNVTIDGNTFTDCKSLYGFTGDSYVGNPSIDQSELDRWENNSFTNNTSIAQTVNVEACILLFTSPPLNFDVSGNVLENSGGFSHTDFMAIGGTTGTSIVSGNTIEGNTRPVQPFTGERPVWADTNTVGGSSELGTEFNTDNAGPVNVYPAWARVRISDIGNGSTFLTSLYQIDAAKLADYPEGFILEFRRSGSGDGLYGVEIQPDSDWNTLPRGYMLFTGGVLKLTKGAGGKFDFTSWTPNTVSIQNISDTYPTFPTNKAMYFYGQLEVNLVPASPHVFTGFAGVAIGETVTINYNANTTIDHVPGLVEMSNGVDFVASGTGSLSATRVGDVLEVTIP